jgi:hypothetical protein
VEKTIIERTNMAKQYELSQRTAQEEAMRQQQAADQEMQRKQGMMDFQSGRMYGGGQQPQPNQMPQIPGMIGSGGAQGGIMNEIALRGNPDDTFSRIIGASPYMPEQFMGQLGNIINNLNAPMQPQEFDFENRKMYGTLDPSSGQQNLQEAAIGLNPGVADTNATHRYVADQVLRGNQATAGATVAAARERAAQTNLKSMQTDQGIVLLDPKTGQITSTDYKAPAKGGSGNDEEILRGLGLLGDPEPQQQGGGVVDKLLGLVGINRGASPAQTATPPIQQPLPETVDPTQDPEYGAQAAAAIAEGWTPEEVMQWIAEQRRNAKGK